MIRMVNAVAVNCDHRDDGRRCDSVLMLTNPSWNAYHRATVQASAVARGWSVADGERCPKHRTTTPEGA